jgi:hypothetical protein
MSAADNLKQDFTKLLETYLKQTGIPNGTVSDKRLLDFYDLNAHPKVNHSPTVSVSNFNGLGVYVTNGRQIKTDVHLPEGEYVVFVKIVEKTYEDYNYNIGYKQIINIPQIHMEFLTNFGRWFTSLDLFPDRIPESLQRNSPAWCFGAANYDKQAKDVPRLTYKLPSLFLEFLEAYEKKNTSAIQLVNEKFYKLIGQYCSFLTDDLQIESSKLATTITFQKETISGLKNQIKNLESELQDKNNCIRSQSTQNNQLSAEISSLKTTIEQKDKSISSLTQEVSMLKRSEQRYKEKLEQKERELADYEAYMRIKKKQHNDT